MADSKIKAANGKHKYPPSVTYFPVLPPAIPTCPPPSTDSPSHTHRWNQCSRIQCPRIQCPRIECPKLEFPAIECPKIDICPPSLCCSDFDAAGSIGGGGSYVSCDTVERESNMITYTDSLGKTTILCSDGSERQATVMKRKDAKGMAHTYCKESETKSRRNTCDKEIKNGKATCNSCSPAGSKPKGKEAKAEGISTHGAVHGDQACSTTLEGGSKRYQTKLDVTPL